MQHNHHNHCAHELKFCEKCDRPYCAKCSREWYSTNWSLYSNPWQQTTYTSGNIGLYDKAIQNVPSYAGQTCAHS